VRALFVIHTPKDPQTAVFKVVAEHAKALQARGHNVRILAPEDFAIARLAGPRFNPLLFPVLLTIWLLQSDSNIDLIKFQSYSGWLFALLRPIRRTWRKLRMVTEFHGLEPLYFAALHEETRRVQTRLSWRSRVINGWFMNWILRVACRRSDRILCLNTSELKFLANNDWAVKENIVLFKNGVPSEFFEVRRNYRCLPPTLPLVGQWNEMKGIRYLVEAFAQTAGEYPELGGYLRLVGRPYTVVGQPINHFTILPRTIRWIRAAGLRIITVNAVGHYLPFPGRPPCEMSFLDSPRWIMRWTGLHSLVMAQK
jgi:glycosyltransferase involved in cell wall biosynthesis